MATIRDESVDFIKGFLIWGVVWGHVISALSRHYFETGAWLHDFFRIYDLPIFMFLSGFFLHRSINKYSFTTLVVNRASMILVPAVFWNIISWATTPAFHIDRLWTGLYFLWAVFLSSLICAVGHFISKHTFNFLEPVLYVVVIVLLHLTHDPWNLFFLFPFFCLGYYMKNVTFRLSTPQFITVLLLFSFGMCFWQVDYNPWTCGSEAWRTDSSAIFIYLYRFCLSVAAVYVMANFFRMLYAVFPAKLTNIVLKAGKETLALYALHLFLMDTVLHGLLEKIDTAWYATNPDVIQNVICYVISPVVSAILIIMLLKVIEYMQKSKLVKWMIGMKVIG